MLPHQVTRRSSIPHCRQPVSYTHLIAEKLPQTAEKLRGFHKSYRSYFLSFAKPQGSEYWDNSLGGAAFRLEIVKDVLEAYVEGKTEWIAELEEERLPLVKSKDGEIISWRDWNGAASSL